MSQLFNYIWNFNRRYAKRNNDSNNILTVSRIQDCLEKPRQDADKLLFANCLKLISLARAEKQVFASTAFEQMIESIVRLACETVCISSR